VGIWIGVESGYVIADRYRLDDRVASGGMSDVWSATDLVLRRAVALKIIFPALLARRGFAQRFRSEAQILAALRHPGIVMVYDCGEEGSPDGEIAYVVMELVEGQPLSERLAGAGRLGVDETMSIVAQAADALHAAHAAGVIHRDVKPANLLLRPDGAVTLVDFGVAKSAGATELTAPDQVSGTALYMAPEQVTKQDADASVDVYALGVVAYECLAGAPPFTGENALAVALRHVQDEPPALPPDVPAPARDIVWRALAKDPDRRFPTAAAFAAAARAVGTPATDTIATGTVDENPTAALAVRPAGFAPADEEPARARSPRRNLLAVAAAAAGLVVVLAAAASVHDGPSPATGDPPATAGAFQPDSTTGGSSGARGDAASSGSGGSSPTGTTTPVETTAASPDATTVGASATATSPSRPSPSPSPSSPTPGATSSAGATATSDPDAAPATTASAGPETTSPAPAATGGSGG
jgi:serine/threonine protein kinase